MPGQTGHYIHMMNLKLLSEYTNVCIVVNRSDYVDLDQLFFSQQL